MVNDSGPHLSHTHTSQHNPVTLVSTPAPFVLSISLLCLYKASHRHFLGLVFQASPKRHSKRRKKKNPNEAQISRLKLNIKKKKNELSLNMGSNSELVRTIESVLGISLGESVSDSVLLIVTTSFAVIIGLLVFVWKRLSNWSSSSSVKPVEVPKFSSSNKDEDDEVEVDSGKTKVSVFFGTQTGTAEGFAKVNLLLFFFARCIQRFLVFVCVFFYAQHVKNLFHLLPMLTCKCKFLVLKANLLL